jgi:protein gp37
MGENSGIQWTTHTFNPWVGCQRVSPGCTNCYAESYDKRVGGGVDPKDGKKKLRWGPTAPRVRTAVSNWRKPLAWDKAAREAGRRDRVFCSSLADVFEDRPELVDWREDLFGLIASTPSLDWLLLTKRPENIARLWPKAMAEPGGKGWLACPAPGAYSWPNVWLGTTVEDQQRANERIPELVKVPAVVHFLSCEPLLDAVSLAPFLSWETFMQHVHKHGPSGQWSIDSARKPIDWIIIGGESGPGARAFSIDWARLLVKQAGDAGAAPFVKQLGRVPFSTFASGCDEFFDLRDPAGGDMAEWPLDLRVREFPQVKP